MNLYGGNQINAYRALLNAIQEYVKMNGVSGVFENIIVNGYDITVRGVVVVDGVVKIGTAFMQ